VLLEEERAKQRDELRKSLTEGMTVSGTISSIRDFGAFVDIGGIEGLLPISEVGWGRVEDIREVLSVGQQVEVAIIKLDWEADRFTFSLRQTQADPWQKVPQTYPEGSVHRGKVARLATFGAFVTLEEGIDGLIHISRLGGGKRLSHPREVVREGEELEVRIEKIDPEARRVSLVPAEISRAREEEEQTLAEYRQKSGDADAGMGTLGDLLKAKLDAQKKSK
jgi:small subunit ribosomal protein S1